MAITTLSSISSIGTNTQLFEIKSLGVFQILLDVSKVYKFIVGTPILNDTNFNQESSLKAISNGNYLIGEKLSGSDNILPRLSFDDDIITASNYLVIKVSSIQVTPIHLRLITLN